MPKTKTIVIGTGGFARVHMDAMIAMKRTTSIVGLVEPHSEQRDKTAAQFARHGVSVPPFYDTIRALIKAQGPSDAALICSPHKFHLEHARDCLKNGIDVCLEKPMVINASEARRLIRLRDRTGRLLVVAFPGSLSPAIRKAKTLITSGAIGRLAGISAYVYQ
ncbi:MAG: Gfo/Idh/MocA family oxidoreductase, partial [Verrucomicrobia bacterium]|nr:Gfo/Idh/MocA family oxidoreductase [Verrucomicrobiota bacterium]